VATGRKRYECLEAGCGHAVEADGDEELVAAVQAHVAEAHSSFELEEFILAGATDVPADSGPAPAGASGRAAGRNVSNRRPGRKT
jgi:predicted small metal-binding protein